jgi:hypothetical protein
VEYDRALFRGAVMSELAPCTVKAARKYVSEWHRHLPDLQGGLFAVKVISDSGECLGVGVFGNPPRVWQGTGRGIISRCATEGAENACSMVYGALCRAAKALGYREVWTYTLPHEPGTSLRAAGFIDMGLTDGGEHDRPSRRRKPAVNPHPKRRWLRQLGNQPIHFAKEAA